MKDWRDSIRHQDGQKRLKQAREMGATFMAGVVNGAVSIRTIYRFTIDGGFDAEDKVDWVPIAVAELSEPRREYREALLVATQRLWPKLTRDVRWTSASVAEATHMVHCNSGGSVFVKEFNFFTQQGGFDQRWGDAWVPVRAVDVEDARRRGCALFKDARPYERQAP